jgi:hypothetical protein
VATSRGSSWCDWQRLRLTGYEMAGWDPETGHPTEAKLAELAVEVPVPAGA